MLVNWKQPRILKHPAIRKLQDDGTWQETTPAVTLTPGINEVDAKAWEVASKSKLFAHYVKAKQLEVIKGTDGKPVSSDKLEKDDRGQILAADHLAKLSEEDALAVVADTTREDLLTAWMDADKRGVVKRACRDVLKKLEEIGRPRKSAAEERRA